ncbi:MAG: 30S ribosomal protein S1 [Deltaproteobacteria bacterium]
MTNETALSEKNKNMRDKEEQNDDNDFAQQLSEQNMRTLQKGMLISGKVVKIAPEIVLFDIGWKTEGYMPKKELLDETGNIVAVVGDEMEMVIEGRDSDGIFVLSRKQIVKNKLWETIHEAQEKGTHISGVVVERVKGGFMVDLGGVFAFLPGSQSDSSLLNEAESHLGKVLTVEVLKYEKKRENVIVSQKSIIKKSKQAQKQETIAKINEGDVVEGVVKNVIDYGVFIDIGGIDGMLHMSDIAWGKMCKPAEHFTNGDSVTVKILSFDREKEKIYLGIKQLEADPWETVNQQYNVGDIVKCKVVNIADYGFFVELSDGIGGLVHRSEFAWNKTAHNQHKVVAVGDEILLKITDIDRTNKKISLSLRQTTENPWDRVKEKYPTGTAINGVVSSITKFGAFVSIEDGIDGLVHVSDISWKRHIKHPADVLKNGDAVSAIVLDVDATNQRISLGMKQAEKNPWDSVEEKYPSGTVITGAITSIADFGVFVEIEDGIDGLVHVSEIPPATGQPRSSTGIFNVGDSITAMVKDIDVKNKKIRMSVKALSEPPATKETKQSDSNKKEELGSSMEMAFANAMQQKEENTK